VLPTAAGPVCAGPFDYINRVDENQTPSPGLAAGLQTYYGAEQPVGNGTGRCYITAEGNVPISVGWELTDGALTNLPDVPPNSEAPVYAAPLPSQASALGLPFKFMIIIYSSGHVPPITTNNEPPHFHAAILVNLLQTTSAPFPLETAPVAAAELPPGVIETILPSGMPVIVPGVGTNYDDPTKPAGLPPLSTLGQNYFYFNGHMNAIVLGPTIDFLASKETFAEAIKQPQIFPVAGVYPHVWITRWNPVKQVHILAVEDFEAAGQVLTP